MMTDQPKTGVTRMANRRISVDTTDTGKRLTEAQCRAIFDEFWNAAVIVNKFGFLPGQTVHIVRQSVADLVTPPFGY